MGAQARQRDGEGSPHGGSQYTSAVVEGKPAMSAFLTPFEGGPYDGTESSFSLLSSLDGPPRGREHGLYIDP